jgi:hypothetical protein
MPPYSISKRWKICSTRANVNGSPMASNVVEETLLRGEIVAPIIIVVWKVRPRGKVSMLLLHKENYPH